MFRSLRHRTVLVNLTDGTAIRGTVIGTVWCLRLASPVIMSGGRQDELDGVARIPRRSVIWIQEV